MTVTDISASATLAVVLALVITVGALRLLPPRPDSAGGQTAYLMRELVAKTGEADRANAENRELRAEVQTLRQRVAELETQVAGLWSMMRQQGIRIDETRADANAAYNEPRSAAVRPPADVTLSEDVPFRDWLIKHFDIDELRTLCADMKLAEFPAILKLEQAATYVVFEARKTGKMAALEQVALNKRPHVPAW